MMQRRRPVVISIGARSDRTPWLVGATLLFLALGALAFAQPASAEIIGKDLLPKFEKLDEDDDGRLSLEEAQADPDIAARFALADHDRNGYLSRQEFDQRAQP